MRTAGMLVMFGCMGCGIYFDEPGGDPDPAPDPDPASCAAAELTDVPPLVPGGYRLELLANDYWGIAPRVIVEVDGSVSGHTSESLWNCSGLATVGELDSLTAALQGADALRRCSTESNCSDSLAYQITVETSEGLQNSFWYDPCSQSIPALDAVVAEAMAIITHVGVGGCTGCPVETEVDECYDTVWGSAYGADRMCLGQQERLCGEASAGEILECAGWDQPSLECVNDEGWVTAAVVSIVDATLERTLDDGYGVPRVNLLLNLRVDNRGASTTSVSDLWSLIQLFDQDGDPMSLVQGSWAVGIPLIEAPGHTNQVYGFVVGSGTDPGSPSLSVPAMTARLPVRPHFMAPLGPPVAVTIVDDPP